MANQEWQIITATYRYRGEPIPLPYITNTHSLNATEVNRLEQFQEPLLNELIQFVLPQQVGHYEQIINRYLTRHNVLPIRFNIEERAALYGLSDICAAFGRLHPYTPCSGRIEGGFGVACLYLDEAFIDLPEEEQAFMMKQDITNPDCYQAIMEELEPNEALFINGRIYDRSLLVATQ